MYLRVRCIAFTWQIQMIFLLCNNWYAVSYFIYGFITFFATLKQCFNRSNTTNIFIIICAIIFMQIKKCYYYL